MHTAVVGAGRFTPAAGAHPYPTGPTRDELAALVTSVSARNGEFR